AGCGTLFVTFAALLSRLGRRDDGTARSSAPDGAPGFRAGPSGPAWRPALARRVLPAAVWAGAAALAAVAVIRPFQSNVACRAGERLVHDDPAQALAVLSRVVER